MMFKTHLAIGIFAVILFWPLVNNPFSFAIVAIIASVIPDIDTAVSKVGRNIPTRITNTKSSTPTSGQLTPLNRKWSA